MQVHFYRIERRQIIPIFQLDTQFCIVLDYHTKQNFIKLSQRDQTGAGLSNPNLYRQFLATAPILVMHK